GEVAANHAQLPGRRLRAADAGRLRHLLDDLSNTLRRMTAATERAPVGHNDRPTVPPFAAAPVLATAAVLAIGLLAVAGRYGYHRDELYFIAAGHHLAWGYPDQPSLVPLIARVMSALAPGSVVVLRTPSVLAAFATVVLTGLTTRELGGGRSAQL